MEQPLDEIKTQDSSRETVFRAALWHELVSMERNARYYEMLYRRHLLYRAIIRWTVALGSLGVLGTILLKFDSPITWDSVPSLILLVIAAAVAGVTAWDFAMNPVGKAAYLHVLTMETKRACEDYGELWTALEAGSIDTAWAKERAYTLQNHAAQLSNILEIATDEELNQQAANDAYRYIRNRYDQAAY